MEDIIKLVKYLEDSGLLLKLVSETVHNEVKEQKGAFLSMLLGTLGGSLLGNILAGKGTIAMSQGRGINRAGKGNLRVSYGTKISTKCIFDSASSFNYFWNKKYYQIELRFNSVYFRDNLPERSSAKIKNGVYVITLDDYSVTGTHWVAL